MYVAAWHVYPITARETRAPVTHSHSQQFFPHSPPHSPPCNGPSPPFLLKAIQEPELRELGMEMLAAVGQAATSPQRLVTLEYRGDPEGTSPTVALVGKGVRPN